MQEQDDRLIEGSRFFFSSGCECTYPVAPSDFDGLVPGYRLIWGYRLIGKPLLCSQPMAALSNNIGIYTVYLLFFFCVLYS